MDLPLRFPANVPLSILAILATFQAALLLIDGVTRPRDERPYYVRRLLVYTAVALLAGRAALQLTPGGLP